MDELVCRICLVTNVKMYRLEKEPIKSYAESISVLSNYLSDSDWKFPKTVCYECAAILLKVSMFVQKCLKAKSVLLGLSTVYQNKITGDTIKKVNRKAMKLESNLNHCHIPPNTYNVVLNFNQDINATEEDRYNTEYQETIKINIKKDPITEDINYPIDDAVSSVKTDIDMEVNTLFDESHKLIVKSDPYIANAEGVAISEDATGLEMFESFYESDGIEYNGKNTRSLVDSENNIFISEPDVIKSSKKKRKKVKTKETKLKQSKEKSSDAKKSKKRAKCRTESKKEYLSAGESEVAKRNALFKERISQCFDIVNLSHEEQVLNLERRKESPLYTTAAYKCHLCYKHFQRSQSYTKHMAEHEPKRGSGYSCPVCKKWVRGEQAYSRHLLTAHSRQYTCKLCHYTCLERNLRIHMNSHAEFRIPFRCALCHFVADVWQEYRRHRRRAHRPSLDCRRCGLAFISARGLRLHTHKMHDQEAAECESLATHACADCDVTFLSEDALKLHLKTSAKHGGVKFDSIIQSEVRKNHVSQIFPRKCDYCPRTLQSAREQYRHMSASHKAHRASYRSLVAHHMCHVCGQAFDSITRLRNHTAQHDETASASLPCRAPSCPALFHNKYQLNLHMKAAHGGVRPHKCPQCELAFKQRATLDRHALVHSGATPYQCPVCEKCFTQSGSRNTHVRTVHQGHAPPPRTRRTTRALPPPAPQLAPS